MNRKYSYYYFLESNTHKMKKQMYSIAIAAITAGTLFTACQSKEKQVENQETKVENDKQNMQAAQDSLNAEYPNFRADAEKKITANDEKISRLRDGLNHAGERPLDEARRRKIDDLQRRNADLRARLDTYKTAQGDWATFKAKFDMDMDSLNSAYAQMDSAKK
jgi:chromosome segregation ATPase